MFNETIVIAALLASSQAAYIQNKNTIAQVSYF